MEVTRVTLLVAVVVAMAVVAAADPRLGDCSHNSHCGPHRCCRVGMMRYSIPQCSPLGGQGSWCRVTNSEPQSLSLHYPNNLQVELEQAHLGMCPCAPGLVCSPQSSTCQPPALLVVNSIDTEEHESSSPENY